MRIGIDLNFRMTNPHLAKPFNRFLLCCRCT
ncbi:Uncharacterised protein [Vibrio cholerae]|nr:Uncharacterised protein [Vibrio cholerae]